MEETRKDHTQRTKPQGSRGGMILQEITIDSSLPTQGSQPYLRSNETNNLMFIKKSQMKLTKRKKKGVWRKMTKHILITPTQDIFPTINERTSRR